MWPLRTRFLLLQQTRQDPDHLRYPQCYWPSRPMLTAALNRIITSQNSIRRSRSAFVTTDTELMAIAAPAIIGLSRIPKKG